MQDFLAIGKDVNERDGDGRSALHYAVAYSHADIVDELVSSGADVEAQASLQWFTTFSCTEAQLHAPLSSFTCAFLVGKAIVAAQDTKKNTPLHYAAGYGRSALVRQLLEAGAQAAAENASGQSALDLVT